MEEYRDIARRMLECIDEDICEAFCTHCGARSLDDECPAGFLIGDPGCARRKDYEELLQDAVQIIEKVGIFGAEEEEAM